MIRHYQYIGWPDIGLPESGVGLIDLIGQIEKWQQQSNNTIITAHCRYNKTDIAVLFVCIVFVFVCLFSLSYVCTVYFIVSVNVYMHFARSLLSFACPIVCMNDCCVFVYFSVCKCLLLCSFVNCLCVCLFVRLFTRPFVYLLLFFLLPFACFYEFS